MARWSWLAAHLPVTAVLLAALAMPAHAELSNAVKHSEQTVPGLQAPAEIILDQWGIPHIYAGSVRDAIFLQGYNAARDRLWQIDLWRKRGHGLLAKDFGPSYAAQDRAARLFLYRGDMEQEWAAYGPEARSYTEAFVAGVNAYVGGIRSGQHPLPIEFRVAGTQPDTWTAEDESAFVDELANVQLEKVHGFITDVSQKLRDRTTACEKKLEPLAIGVKAEGKDEAKEEEDLVEVMDRLSAITVEH